MNSSSVADRILQALLEIVGDKFNAEVEAHILMKGVKRKDEAGQFV